MSDKLTDSEKWTSRQLAKYLEENPDVRVEIDKDDIGKTDGVLTDSELEQMTGFAICKFPPDSDLCESCGEPYEQLYFRGPSDAGTYLCRPCVVRLYEENLE